MESGFYCHCDYFLIHGRLEPWLCYSPAVQFVLSNNPMRTHGTWNRILPGTDQLQCPATYVKIDTDSIHFLKSSFLIIQYVHGPSWWRVQRRHWIAGSNIGMAMVTWDLCFATHQCLDTIIPPLHLHGRNFIANGGQYVVLSDRNRLHLAKVTEDLMPVSFTHFDPWTLHCSRHSPCIGIFLLHGFSKFMQMYVYICMN